MGPNMGEDKCALQSIPCACVSFIDQYYHAWIPGKPDSEHPRYSSVI